KPSCRPGLLLRMEYSAWVVLNSTRDPFCLPGCSEWLGRHREQLLALLIKDSTFPEEQRTRIEANHCNRILDAGVPNITVSCFPNQEAEHHRCRTDPPCQRFSQGAALSPRHGLSPADKPIEVTSYVGVG